MNNLEYPNIEKLRVRKSKRYGEVNFSKMRKSDVMFVESLGFTILEPIYDVSQSGWCKLEMSVPSHQDCYGLTFLYCARGSGTLTVHDDLRSHKNYTLSEKKWTVFNDFLYHEFRIDESPCYLLAVNIASPCMISDVL